MPLVYMKWKSSKSKTSSEQSLGSRRTKLRLVIPLSYRDSDSDNLQDFSSNSIFGDFFFYFLHLFFYWIVVPLESLH